MARHKPSSPDETPRVAPLTEDDIRAQTDSGSFSRGRTYARQGRIRETVLRGAMIEALCQGSDVVPYRVRVTFDAAMIGRQAHAAFTSVDPWEWRAASGVSTDLRPLLELGQSYVNAGRWADAQAVYTALAEEAREWLLSFNDEEGEIASLMVTCDEVLAACLDAQAELPEDERLSGDARAPLIRTLYDIWHADIFEAGGVDLSQHGPEAIARNVTDEERAMVDGWLREEQADGWSRRALTGFLVMLREHAGLNDEELLTIYRDAELWDEVALMLLRLDRVDEAVSLAGRHLTEPYALTAFANALIEHIGRALTLVDDRLWELEGKNPVHDAVLQQWLVDQFSSHDRPQDALAMAERRFRRQPSLQTYHAVRDAAGLPGHEPGAWSEARPRLERHLREKEAWTVLVDEFLEESDVRAALDAYARQTGQGRQGLWYAPTWSYDDQPLRLAQAAERNFPTTRYPFTVIWRTR